MQPEEKSANTAPAESQVNSPSEQAQTPQPPAAPSAEAKASVTKALAEIGCASEDIDAEGDGYEADDATCKDGKYDITLDNDFKIVNREKDND